jgi:MFS family permease
MFKVLNDDMAVFGAVAAIAVILEVLATLAYGQLTDKFCTLKSFKFTPWMLGGGYSALFFFATTPVSLLVADSVAKTALSAYLTSTKSALHKIVRTGDQMKLLMYGTAWQVLQSLGQVGAIVFLIIAYYFVGDDIYGLAFLLAFGASFVSYLSIVKGGRYKAVTENEDGTS